jgi:hypothetical protein
MKLLISSILVIGALSGCVLPLRPGHGTIRTPSGIVSEVRQSENPKTPTTQEIDRVTDDGKTREHIKTVIGSAQKDTARELGAKLASLKSCVWVGILVFLFGAASLFYPPLKLIVGSMTTSIVACVAGVVLIILPSLVVGHEILILSVAGGAVVLYFFAHRHGQLRGVVDQLTKKF